MSLKTDPVRHQYDQLAGDYDRRWRPYIDATLSAVQEAVRLDGDETVLDVPCGTGELERRLLARWPALRMTGADVSPGMLEQARNKDTAKRVQWVEADVSRLPMADVEFDWVVCANSFHYFPRPNESLRELRRVLRPGGTLVLVDWCDDYLTCKLCSLWLRWTDSAFFRTYSLDACRLMLEHNGLQVLDQARFRTSWLWGLMRFVCRRAE